MKRYLTGILFMILLAMLLPGTAMGRCICDDDEHDWGPWKYHDGIEDYQTGDVYEGTTARRDCRTCGRTEVVYSYADGRTIYDYVGNNVDPPHNWSDWIVTKEANCMEEGTKVRTCSNCGKTKTASIPKGDHDWFEFDTQYDAWGLDSEVAYIIDEYNLDIGYIYRYCWNCHKIEKLRASSHIHKWGDWKVTQKATCKQNGTKTRTCSACGKQETESIPKSTAHQFGDWEVSTEATCTKDGKEKCFCKICGASRTRVIEKLGHSYGEYEIIVEATDCSKGKRASTCARCGKQLTEEFYPEGTLYKGGNNPPEAVKALQTALADLGLYKNKIVGEYGNGTFNAVSKFEKDYLGMKGDGIAWPKVIRALGVHRGKKDDGTGEEWDEGPVSSDTSRVRLLLEAVQTSPRWDYAAGDTITIQWTLTNLSEKDEASSIRVYQYNGMKADKKKDREIAQPENLTPGGTQSGTFEYTITAEDEAAGRFSVGFIARGRIRKKDESSNRVWFNFHTGAGEPEVSPIDWATPADPSETRPPKDGDNKTDKDSNSGKDSADSGKPSSGPDDSPETGDKSGDGSWEPPADSDGTRPEETGEPANNETTACGRVLIAEGNGRIEYEISECGKHEAAAAESARLTEAGDYAGAMQLWDGEIAALYQEWAAGADEEGRRRIEADRTAFENQMKALEASLRLVCSENEAAAVIVKERMNKCLSLCDELHTAPAPRTDSFLSEHTMLSGAGDSDTCMQEIIPLGSGSVHTVSSLCRDHRETLAAARQLAESAGSAEEKAAAWQETQKKWLLALNTMYDKWYLSADKSLRETIAADRLSFDELVDARRNALAILYPSDPATAAEALATMIMERTELICGLLRPTGILKD